MFLEYLYIPLGGNRRGQARTVINKFTVFLLCGLWHGAAWTFVVWGAASWSVLDARRTRTDSEAASCDSARLYSVGRNLDFHCVPLRVFRAGSRYVRSAVWSAWCCCATDRRCSTSSPCTRTSSCPCARTRTRTGYCPTDWRQLSRRRGFTVNPFICV